MKIVAVSPGCEQLAKRNVCAPNEKNGWTYRYFTDFGGIANAKADILWLGGYFVQDYDAWGLQKAIAGDYKRIVIHWVGSDTLACRTFFNMGQRELFRQLRSDRFLHIPASANTKKELKEWFGIESGEPLDIPAEKVFQEMPKPEAPSVAFYLPPHSVEFYGAKELYAMTQMFKDHDYNIILYHWLPLLTEFKVVGISQMRFGITREQYEQVIADSTCILRIPEHDAVSISAGEFMMAGRPFISQHEIPLWPARLKDLEAQTIHSAIEKTLKNPVVPPEVQLHYRNAYDPHRYHERVMIRCMRQWPELQVDIPEEAELVDV